MVPNRATHHSYVQNHREKVKVKLPYKCFVKNRDSSMFLTGVTLLFFVNLTWIKQKMKINGKLHFCVVLVWINSAHQSRYGNTGYGIISVFEKLWAGLNIAISHAIRCPFTN